MQTILTYRCNGLLTWWVSLSLLTLVTIAQLNESKHPHSADGGSLLRVFSLDQWAAQSGPIMTVSILWANALSLFLIVQAYITRSEQGSVCVCGGGNSGIPCTPFLPSLVLQRPTA